MDLRDSPMGVGREEVSEIRGSQLISLFVGKQEVSGGP